MVNETWLETDSKLFRDGPLEKLWGGGEGNFRVAGIFFVIKFLVRIFLRQ